MTARTFRAFTLIELIVVMAIIVTLSVIGFISYNSYVMDGRNAARVAQLDDITKAIDQFIYTNARAPQCGIAEVKICYFTDAGVALVAAKKGGLQPIIDTGCTGGTCADTGILSTDWSQLNFKTEPLDPRKVYFTYAYNGSNYAVFATKELSGGYSTIVKGSAAMEKSGATNVVKNVLGLSYTNGVEGHGIVGNVLTGYPANPKPILSNDYDSTTNGGVGSIPYLWP